MGLQDKIEEIRRKPEHIRIRYVWMWVAISMVIVIAIWIISIVAQNGRSNDAESLSRQQLLEQFQDQKKSLQDVTNQAKNLQEQTQKGINSAQNSNLNNENRGEGMFNQ
jgi:uncharacterized protein YlxW (UPF0749 family)